VVPLPHLAIGDYPFQLVRVGNRLVFPCREGTCDVDTSLTSIERLGDSWFYVPDAARRLVWLMTLDPKSPETVRALKAVRAVGLDGRVMVRSVRPPHGDWPSMAAGRGLVFQRRRAMVVWDPRTKKITRRLPDAIGWVAGWGDLLAWCAPGCGRLYVRDLGTGHTETAVPPSGFWTFCGGTDAAISPDGRWLAVPVETTKRFHRTHAHQRSAVLLVDVASGTARLIPDSSFPSHCSQETWDSSGRYLFMWGGAAVAEYRLGTRRAIRLHVHLPKAASFMAAS